MAAIERRKGKDGSTSYRVKVRLQGDKPRTRTFARLTDAKAWARDVETDLGRRTYVPTTTDRRRTLGDLIDKYLTEYQPYKPNNKGADKEARLLAWWKSEAGYVTLDKLTPETIASFKPALRKRRTRAGAPVTSATTNRYLAALSAVCKYAWKEIRWLPANPVLAVTKGSESDGVVRLLEDDERRRLLQACRESDDRDIAVAVVLALATGARYSNIRNLTWADVDRTGWRLTFRQTKNSTPRSVPVVGIAQDALQQHYERDPTGEGWVFKGRNDGAPADLEKRWRALRDRAGLVGFRFHDLRHAAGSMLTAAGATLAEVAEALGHRTLVMARRYSNQSGEHVRATMEKIADKLKEDKA